jgi:CheY-like chemotaxis protein
VINGAEAIEGQGQVTVSTCQQMLSEQQGTVYGVAGGMYAVLHVSDTGPGIAKEDLDHIFEPFFTKKELGRSGTGLGLTIVWNAVQEHDGAVHVISDEKGTRFELLFPLVESVDAVPPLQEKDWRDYCGAGENILLVDDDEQQLEIASNILKTLNYSVVSIRSGEEAVQYLQEKNADLLVLDMLMEPGMNGRQTYEEVLKFHPQQKAIIVSGYSESEDVRKAMSIGAGAFLHKPYTLVQLGQTVYCELHGAV